MTTRREFHERKRAARVHHATALRLLLEDAHGRRAESPALYQALLEYEEALVEAHELLDEA